jgi:amino acid permease
MASEDTDLFPDRAELLSGVPTKRADTLLFLIESRTAHLVARSRREMERFVTEEDLIERELAFFEAFSQGREAPLVPTIQHLERHSWQWAPLVAQNPQIQAAVANRLGKKYRFTYQDVPGIRRALGLDDAEVRRAYRRLYRQPLEQIFASRVSLTDRLRWAWAAVGARFARLPPFWTAYSLTLTETVGATILALPIALATIGPLPGVAILVVLGLVNIVTVAFMAEAVTRSGAMRYGSAYLGRLVGDYLGTTGSLIISVGLFVLCLLALSGFYVGISKTLEDATSVWAPAWVVVLFLVGLHYLRRESLNATVASALAIGGVNIALLLVLVALAFIHLQTDNLLHATVPFASGRPFDASILELIFGVILAAYFGHSSVSLCGRLVLRRDPSGRSLMWGCVAAQASAMLLYCLFLLAVNGAVAPGALAEESGTALSPLTTEVGSLSAVFGSVFAVLGMGMVTIHFSLALSSLTRERLPSEATPVVVLPRQRARLRFQDRRRRRSTDRLRISVTYLGLRGGDPAFRLEAGLHGDVHRTEISTTGSWEILGPTGLPSLMDRFEELRDSGLSLVLEIIDATPQVVRLKATTSMRTTVEGVWDSVGLSLAGVLGLTDPEAELVGWIMRQGDVTLSDVAGYAGKEEAAIRATLASLVDRGLVREMEGGSRYAARLAARRGRALPEEIWGALTEEGSDVARGTSDRTSSRWKGVRRMLLGRRGRFVLGATPVFVSFAVAEWMLISGSGSFAGLLGFIGVIVVSVVAGIFPVLLLVASRRKGEYVPTAVYRVLGHPVLLGGLYLLFLGSIVLHGLVIWEEPWLRAGALLVGAGILVMTGFMVRRGAFIRRLNIEVREDQRQGRTFFAVTADGRERTSHVLLEYPDGAQRLEASLGEIPTLLSLRHAVFEPSFGNGAGGTPRELMVRVHKVTPEGDSDAMAGTVTVHTGGEPKRFDIKLAGGQVTLPVTDACRVDIELTGSEEAKTL